MFERIEKEVLVKEGKMRNGIYMIAVMLLVLVGCATIGKPSAHAIEPKLLWTKTFESTIMSAEMARDTGDVILSTSEEVILYDKDGNERFHWGPRVDRGAGIADISDDGMHYAFISGYTPKYLEKKGLSYWEGMLVHFYDTETKKELWNKEVGEAIPMVLPGGDGVLLYWWMGGLKLYNTKGEPVVNEQSLEIESLALAPDGSHYAAINYYGTPLMLFDKSGTKLWEKGRHVRIVSISDNASYITTRPYSLGLSFSADAEKTHEGIVYDKDGNIVMHGFGVVSADGKRLAMYSPEKVVIYGLPDKEVLYEVDVQAYISGYESAFFASFSGDNRYLILRGETSLRIYDLEGNLSKEIVIKGLGKLTWITLSKDGKYLLAHPSEDRKNVYFYQLNKLKGVEGWVRPIKNMVSFTPEVNKVRRWSYV